MSEPVTKSESSWVSPSSGLQDLLDRHAAKLRIGFPFWLRPFVLSNVLALTLGRRIYLSRGLLTHQVDAIEATLRHELVHVRQVETYGLVAFFYVYVRDFVRLRRSGLSSSDAYLSIPFEVEARLAEAIASEASPEQRCAESPRKS